MCCGNIKKTTEQFIEELEKINTDIEVLGEYINNHTFIECECKIDGYRWSSTPHNLLSQKTGCPMCGGTLKLTHKQFIKKFIERNKNAKNIEILSEYDGNSKPILCKCKIDGYEWNSTPHRLLGSKNAKPSGCPKCSGKAKKTTEGFKEELFLINPYIEVLGEYTNNATKILCRCKIDDSKWFPTPNDLLTGRGCPMCNSSKGEKRIANYFKDNNIDFIPQKMFDNLVGVNGGSLSYDFYLPKYNLLIEYQGEYHDHSVPSQTDFEFALQQEHDKRKREYAKENNIQLLEIWYWDFDNIEKILDKIRTF